jgi:hypothetical protein
MTKSATIDDDIFKLFLEFISEHNKNYKDSDEFHHRLSIFAANHKEIGDHNATSSGFEMGHNHFSDLTEAEFMELYARD